MKRSTWIAVLVTATVLVAAGNLPRARWDAAASVWNAALARGTAAWPHRAHRTVAAPPSHAVRAARPVAPAPAEPVAAAAFGPTPEVATCGPAWPAAETIAYGAGFASVATAPATNVAPVAAPSATPAVTAALSPSRPAAPRLLVTPRSASGRHRSIPPLAPIAAAMLAATLALTAAFMWNRSQDRRGLVFQMARRGLPATRIARRARVPQDAVRTLLTPGMGARR